ncbi:MAG: hypothetical protein SF172_06660 [Burkholderiales bacterium]|nr:hypothetical protein [Burkholderiales bacterium]
MIAVGDWQPADGLTLEPNALRAAREIERCLALTAGPGAGKTEMLAQLRIPAKPVSDSAIVRYAIPVIIGTVNGPV